MPESNKGLNAESFESMLDDFDEGGDEESDATPEPEPVPEVTAEEVDEVVEEVPAVEEVVEAAPEAPVLRETLTVEEELTGQVDVPPDAEPDDVLDTDSEYTYLVQKGFTQDGRTFHPGETIPVKCRFCVFWEKEWLGAVRCKPGKKLDEEGNTMRADIFSCESFFVCKELEPEMDAFLGMELAEVLTVRRMLSSMKKLLNAEAWLNDQVDKKAMDVDKVQVFKSAKGFITSFTSTEQLEFAEQFLRTFARKLSMKDKTKKPPKLKFEAGDWIEWVDLTTKEVYKGVVISKGRGQIKVAVTEGEKAGHSWSFNFREFQDKRSPKILRKSVHEDER